MNIQVFHTNYRIFSSFIEKTHFPSTFRIQSFKNAQMPKELADTRSEDLLDNLFIYLYSDFKDKNMAESFLFSYFKQRFYSDNYKDITMEELPRIARGYLYSKPLVKTELESCFRVYKKYGYFNWGDFFKRKLGLERNYEIRSRVNKLTKEYVDFEFNIRHIFTTPVLLFDAIKEEFPELLFIVKNYHEQGKTYLF